MQIRRVSAVGSTVIASEEMAVLVLAYCGLRWREAIGLRVKDLDMLRGA